MQKVIWMFAIIEWCVYIYLPAVAIYGGVKVLVTHDVAQTITSPFFGLKKVSMKWGFTIWMLQVFCLGILFATLGLWYRYDIKPILIP